MPQTPPETPKAAAVQLLPIPEKQQATASSSAAAPAMLTVDAKP